jgi:hypothetical protein
VVTIRLQIAGYSRCARSVGVSAGIGLTRLVEHRSGRMGAVVALCLLLSSAACNSVPGEKFQAVQRDLFASQERVRQLENELAAQQETTRELGRRVSNLGHVKGVADNVLIIPEKITLASMCGGYDDDGKGGDDGIVLYIQPIDRDQHVVKAAGTLKIKLIDPQNPAGQTEFAEYNFDLEHTRALWYGRMMTNHFSVKCPWPAGHLPAHNEIVAYVTFTDLLSGKTLTATGTYTVTLPIKETQPAAR